MVQLAWWIAPVLVSESLNFMSKRVLRRRKHPVAIGEPC